MSGFTKALRQRIVREFATRHNGNFNPALFLEEVRRQGKAHAAYDWFEWNKDKAAVAYQVEQAREFARDLRVTFRVEEVIGKGSVRVHKTEMPAVISPMAGRQRGGGYVLVDPNDPAHIEEHCRQAARTLGEWMKRYEAALAHANVKVVAVQSLIGKLEAAAERKAA